MCMTEQEREFVRQGVVNNRAQVIYSHLQAFCEGLCGAAAEAESESILLLATRLANRQEEGLR